MSTPTANHQQLKTLTTALRDVHRQLTEITKLEYERESGSEIDAAHLLQLLTKDSRFDWLHELSEFIVVVDELLDQEGITDEDVRGILVNARTLITPEEGADSRFYRRYVGYLQHHPALTMAHANLRKILKNP